MARRPCPDEATPPNCSVPGFHTSGQGNAQVVFDPVGKRWLIFFNRHSEDLRHTGKDFRLYVGIVH